LLARKSLEFCECSSCVRALSSDSIGFCIMKQWVGVIVLAASGLKGHCADVAWSLQPVARPAEPKLASRAWAVNPIDSFIFSKLAENKLAPSPPADRRTLIRRLSFDLIGLPPSPEDVRAFEQDKSPEAYTRLVERL